MQPNHRMELEGRGPTGSLGEPHEPRPAAHAQPLGGTLLKDDMRLSALVTLGLLGCAPSLVLPPITAGPEWDHPNQAPLASLPATPPDAPPVHHDYDEVSGYTRYSVTTHRGIYTGWVEKPQITFFALASGRTPPSSPPDRIGLVFRTLEPEAVTGTQLLLGCGDRTDSVGLAVASFVTPTGNTHSHFLTYFVPTPQVAAFAACSEGWMEIGRVHAPFSTTHLGGLRALLRELGAEPQRSAT